MIQGAVLAGAGLITKLIGFAYRIPVANILGDQGNGLYSIAFGIYNIALTLSSYSLPLAVSKLVSARLAKKEYKNSYRVLMDALLFALIAGGLAFALLFFGADALADIYQSEGLEQPLRILAPTVFIVAFLGVFRGFFQGMKNMVPTAMSQILEQIVNAIVSVVAAYQLTRIFAESGQVAAYGAMGSTIGTLAGAASALALVALLFILYRPRFQKKMLHDTNEDEDHALICKALILTVIPVILSQTIYQIGHTLDDFLFGNLMKLKGFEEAVIKSMQGVYSTQYNQLVNLPVAIATALAATTIPNIVQLNVQKKHDEARAQITSVIKINMVIAIPAAVGIAVLAKPIMMLLYPNLVTYQPLAVNFLMFGSSAVVFYALSTITTSILQGSNYMKLPVIHSLASLIMHVIIVAGLLYFTDLGAYALLIGNVSFPLIVSLLNCRSVAKHLNYRFCPMALFGTPLVASLMMGIATLGVYHSVHFIIPSNFVAILFAIIAAVIVYVFVILGGNCFTDQEIIDLPMGLRILKLRNKIFRRK